MIADAPRPESKRFSLVPYLQLMRLHQRTGIWLLLWPCWWSIALASGNIVRDIWFFAVFLVGAVIMRSAGCIINDIWDRDIDPHVTRTKMRPLASGVLKLRHALVLLGLLLGIGLAILLMLNALTIFLGLGFTILIIIYPLMKRVMRLPQIFLGLTFNAGALMGWSAVRGELSLSAGLLYAVGFFWTLGYDTIYAHQDKLDDAKIGVNSAALAFGMHTKSYIILCYVFIGILLVAIGVLGMRHWFYYLGVMIAFAHLMWQILTVQLDDHADCMRKFRSNVIFGAIVFIAILISGGII